MASLFGQLALKETRQLQLIKTEHGEGQRNKDQCEPTQYPGILQYR